MKKLTLLLAVIFMFCAINAFAQSPFFPPGSTWKYLDDGSDQGTAWQALTYDDSGWKEGPAQLGFGEGDEATTLTSGYITYYFRKKVTIDDPNNLSNIVFSIVHDDGMLLHINEVEAARSELIPAGPVNYLTGTTTYIPNDVENNFFNYSVPNTMFVAGENIIAIEVHQQTVSSSDVSFDCSFNGDYTPTPTAQWKSFKPLASSDDAEEHTDTNASEGIGGMEPLDSSDLELGNESGTNNQIVGIRFPGVDIVQGATIDSAYIQFTCDDDNTGAFTVFVWAEDADNAETFAETAFNISSRLKTDAVQMWSIPDWINLDERGPNQRTTDLAALVQEVIDRPGWASGNAMAFIIHGENGEREAEAWDEKGADNTTGHPELFVKVSGGTAVEGTDDDVVVRTYKLLQNYPNPFNPSTTIEFAVPKSGFYSLRVYNLSGQEVADLISDNLSEGSYKIDFKSDNLSSGIYIYKLVGENINISKRMVLLK